MKISLGKIISVGLFLTIIIVSLLAAAVLTSPVWGLIGIVFILKPSKKTKKQEMKAIPSIAEAAKMLLKKGKDEDNKQ